MATKAEEITKKRGVFGTLKKSFEEFNEDECMNLAAAVAYFAFQSIIPLILGFIAIASFLLQDPATKQQFIEGANAAIPESIASTIDLNDLLTNFAKGAGTVGFIAILTLLWTGSGIFDQLIFATNKAFDVEKDTRNFFLKLALRMFMLLVLGGLLALSFAVTFIAQLIFSAKVELFGISPANFNFLLPVISYVIPILIQTLIFAILFRIGPARKGLKWKPILLGAFITSLLFELLKFGFTLYVTTFGAADSATKTYGALGGIIVFLLFIYLVAAVILFGAEITATMHNFSSGSDTVKTKDAMVEVPEGEHHDNVTTEEEQVEGISTGGTNRSAAQPKGTTITLPVEKESKLKTVLGAVFLIVVGIGSIIFQKKTNYKA